MGKIKYNPKQWKFPILIGVATEGWIRYEWHNAKSAQIIPINWQASGFDIDYSFLGFNIDDAYNLMAKEAIKLGVEWLLIIEDDVLIPPDFTLKMNKYVKNADIPVVSGLYFSKGHPSEPLVFRGRGNGCYYKWKPGEKVWCDGLPMGCLLIHMSIIKHMWGKSPPYTAANGEITNKVFVTPRHVDFNFSPFSYTALSGTQDLFFFDKILDENKKILRESGWSKIAKKKYPFLCDTGIFCKHIDRKSGKQYPL